MKVGLTFGKRLLLGYFFVLSMMMTIGLMAYCAMNTLTHKAEHVNAIDRCVSLFRNVERSEKKLNITTGDKKLSVELASNDWKKAKDKFLSEVKKLSQTASLGEGERQVIKTIEESWKEYEVSFHRYILAFQSKDYADRAVWEAQAELSRTADEMVTQGEKFANMARESMSRVHVQMQAWLSMAILSAAGLGLMVMLVNIRLWNRALGRAMNRLGKNSSRISTASSAGVSADELKSQAQQIRQAMGELMDLLGQENMNREEEENVKIRNEKP
jgi:hypothetical protein